MGDREEPVEVVSRAAIGDAVERIARAVGDAYAGRSFLAVPVMNAAIYFATDLLRALHGRARVSGVHAAFVSSYGPDGRPRPVPALGAAPPTRLLAGADVLVVDTVVDTGRTVGLLAREFLAAGAREVRVACLLDKPARRKAAVRPDFAGLDAPDRFLVGYGLDRDGKYRTLPYVGTVSPLGSRPDS